MDTQKVVKHITFFVLFFLVLSCENKNIPDKKNVEILGLEESTTSSISNFSLLKVEDKLKLFELKGKLAFFDEKNKLIDIKIGKIYFFDKKNTVANVEFQLARFYVDTENIDFYGKVIIHTVENEKIITYDIKYIRNEDKIYSNKEIEIYKDNSVVRGIGFETLDRFRTIRIYKNVITTD